MEKLFDAVAIQPHFGFVNLHKDEILINLSLYKIWIVAFSIKTFIWISLIGYIEKSWKPYEIVHYLSFCFPIQLCCFGTFPVLPTAFLGLKITLLNARQFYKGWEALKNSTASIREILQLITMRIKTSSQREKNLITKFAFHKVNCGKQHCKIHLCKISVVSCQIYSRNTIEMNFICAWKRASFFFSPSTRSLSICPLKRSSPKANWLSSSKSTFITDELKHWIRAIFIALSAVWFTQLEITGSVLNVTVGYQIIDAYKQTTKLDINHKQKNLYSKSYFFSCLIFVKEKKLWSSREEK